MLWKTGTLPLRGAQQKPVSLSTDANGLAHRSRVTRSFTLHMKMLASEKKEGEKDALRSLAACNV